KLIMKSFYGYLLRAYVGRKRYNNLNPAHIDRIADSIGDDLCRGNQASLGLCYLALQKPDAAKKYLMNCLDTFPKSDACPEDENDDSADIHFMLLLAELTTAKYTTAPEKAAAAWETLRHTLSISFSDSVNAYVIVRGKELPLTKHLFSKDVVTLPQAYDLLI